MDPIVTVIIVCAVAAVGVIAAFMQPIARACKAGDGASPLLWFVTVALTWPLIALMLDEALQLSLNPDMKQLLQAAPIVCVGAVTLLLGLRRRSRPTAAGSVFFVALLAVSAVALFGDASVPQLVLAVALAAIVLIGADKRARERSLLGLRLSAVLLTTALAAYAILAMNTVIDSGCGLDQSKCFILPAFVNVGGGGGSNAFGLTLAAFLPSSLLGLPGWRVALGFCSGTLALLANGSRAALLAFLLGAALILFASFVRRHAVWLLAVGVAAVASAAPLVLRLPDGSLTGRATLWQRAQEFFLQQPWFGGGTSFWVRQTPFETFPKSAYSPHSLWWELLVAVGLVGTIVLAAGLVFLLLRSSSQALPVVGGLFIGVLLTGILEATVMPYRFGPVSAPLLALLVVMASSARTLTSTRQRTSSAVRAAPQE